MSKNLRHNDQNFEQALTEVAEQAANFTEDKKHCNATLSGEKWTTVAQFNSAVNYMIGCYYTGGSDYVAGHGHHVGENWKETTKGVYECLGASPDVCEWTPL